MLKQVVEGVLVHESEFLQSNAVVLQGRAGVLLVDPGITGAEMATIAKDLSGLGQPVAAGFSTHPDWDHVLWHAELGEGPRYGTARCAPGSLGMALRSGSSSIRGMPQAMRRCSSRSAAFSPPVTCSLTS
jgi:glyoxylase-like metal-dependent hydrolase (beta-lactamase superfamily II)